MLTGNHVAYGFIYFFPGIVKAMHFGDRTITLAIEAPPYLIAGLCSVLNALHSDRTQERGWHIAIPMLITATGFVISIATLNGPARYVAAFLYTGGVFSSLSLVTAWAVQTLNQTPEKRAAVVSLLNAFSQVGTIVAPYFFLKSQQPRYVLAMALMMAFALVNASLAVILKWWFRRTKVVGERSQEPRQRTI